MSKSDYDPNKIDVLYFVSTDVLSAKDDKGNVSWQSLLIPEDVASMTGEIAWVENNMFYNDFNFSAPLYHQFTFDAICQLSKDSFDIVYKKVANEALHLSAQEVEIFKGVLAMIEQELHHAIDKHTRELVVSHIELLLNYCLRFFKALTGKTPTQWRAA